MQFFHRIIKSVSFLILLGVQVRVMAQATRLLRQPALSATQVVFEYGADIWVADKNGGDAHRITSTAAIESDPHFSPDGHSISFSSNRSGNFQVYIVPAEGGTPTRLTWYPAASFSRGFSPDGKKIIYASSRETAPTDYRRLWTIPVSGGASTLLPAPWGHDAAYSPDGKKIIVDRVSRWDTEFRHYKGGQNTALQILNLATLQEKSLPNDSTKDVNPYWQGDEIFFLSDRDFIENVWAYNVSTAALRQVTQFTKGDVKWLSGNGKELVFERNGDLQLLDPVTGNTQQLTIKVTGDFPWAEPHWESVKPRFGNVSLSPTGKRILAEARGEIFTVPVENGNARNLTQSSGAADRHPLWSPDGKQVAWFSDKEEKGYALYLTDQEGKNEPRQLSIGESKLAWEPTWSPDGKYIAFEDDDVRIRILELANGKLTTVDTSGTNIERGNMGLTWSPDSKWLAYAKTAPNNFHRITIWSMQTGKTKAFSDPLADAVQPAWDRGGKYLYFLASTDVALGSGWANTSSITAKPEFGAYLTVLRKNDPPPFPLKTDDEPDSTTEKKAIKEKDTTAASTVKIDWDNLDRRTLALPIAVGNYDRMISGPKGTVFIGEELKLNKFSIEDKKAEEFAKDASQVTVSANGEKILFKSGDTWRVVSTGKTPGVSEGTVAMNLMMEINRLQEWKQIFTEAWRYERDYFYDTALHGRNWQEVWEQYSPLIPFVRHREDLTYLLDQLGGELSVGHSFVFGGDFPATDDSHGAVPGADLVINEGRWQIKRIYTAESWNPGLEAPLDQPNLKVKEGDYIIAIDGKTLTSDQDPYELLDGKADMQTELTLNSKPSADGAWTIRIKPVKSETALRQRAWVEDNRRKVDELSNGKLAYVWVPNTGGPGFVSFNRYYFSQQDKDGAVIDERFNGGGLLDDYMVDLMVRRLRAAVTNEVPGGNALRLPAGISGPKVLLINELAGSGGDFFPWIFRHQKVGPLIGTRTWGGLVKSSVHYALIDGGAITAPDNAVFDPEQHKWVAENQGVPPDIEQKIDAISVSKGKDIQLEKAVQECLLLLQKEPKPSLEHPPYSTPAKKH